MISVLLSFLFATAPAPVGAPAADVADQLTCRVTAGSDPRRCTVAVPAGRSIRSCRAADAKAGHCGKHGDRKYVAWVAETSGAKCKVSKKRTDWTRRVTLSMSKKSAKGAAACTLYVELQ